MRCQGSGACWAAPADLVDPLNALLMSTNTASTSTFVISTASRQHTPVTCHPGTQENTDETPHQLGFAHSTPTATGTTLWRTFLHHLHLPCTPRPFSPSQVRWTQKQAGAHSRHYAQHDRIKHAKQVEPASTQSRADNACSTANAVAQGMPVEWRCCHLQPLTGPSRLGWPAAEDLAALFPMGLIQQEVSTDRWVTASTPPYLV